MRGNQDTCWIHARYIITCYIHAGYVYMYRSENVSMASSCAARAWKRVVCVTSEACCVNVHTSFSWRPTALAPQLFRDWLFTPPVSRFTVNKKAQIFSEIWLQVFSLCLVSLLTRKPKFHRRPRLRRHMEPSESESTSEWIALTAAEVFLGT